jgi:hypothetical protein
VVTEEVAVPAAARCTKCLDWRVAVRVVTYRRVEWAIDSFAPYRDISSLVKRKMEDYLVKFLHTCLGTGYVPALR